MAGRLVNERDSDVPILKRVPRIAIWFYERKSIFFFFLFFYFPSRIIFITENGRGLIPLVVKALIHLSSTVSTKKLTRNMRFT